MEAKLSAGIVRLKAADLNIPERDCCGEAVEGGFIPLIFEENVPLMKQTSLSCGAQE